MLIFVCPKLDVIFGVSLFEKHRLFPVPKKPRRNSQVLFAVVFFLAKLAAVAKLALCHCS